MKIIGVAGGSASGKTTFCHFQKKNLAEGEVEIISLDSYYICNSKLSPEQRRLINYDHPDAFEFELLLEDLNSLRKGFSVNVPVYDFSSHSRSKEVFVVHPTKWLLVEGILTFVRQELLQFFDYTVFVDTPAEIRLQRRLARDTKERGRTADSILEQWQTTVQPMYQQYCEPTKSSADSIVDGTTPNWPDILSAG